MSNIKEFFRAEIKERIALQKDLLKRAEDSARIEGSIDALQGLLNSIDIPPDEPVSNDLEEAAEKSAVQYYVDGGYSPFPNIEMASHIAGFKAGAEWQKRKMMEGAVAVEVIGEKRDLRLIDSTQLCLFDAKRGDWLKIIIVNEEEK